MSTTFARQQLEAVRRSVIESGRRAELAATQAFDALTRGNVSWANALAAEASVAPRLCASAQRSAAVVIATRQPTSTDLANAMTTIFVAEEVARLAEHAAAIAALAASRAEPLETACLPALADRAFAMLDDALTAFGDERPACAERAIVAADEVRAFAQHVRRRETAWASDADADAVVEAVHLLGSIAEAAARIARRVSESGQAAEALPRAA